MAQWNGQFTGNTHSTKVQDLEELLQRAIGRLRDEDARDAKQKNVYKIAEKLLKARLKLLKAKICDEEPVTNDNKEKRDRRFENLRQKLAATQGEGVNGILIEFDARELMFPKGTD